jgi:hypothetical protein
MTPRSPDGPAQRSSGFVCATILPGRQKGGSMSILQNALAAQHLILSSAGAHAGQAWHKIIARKQSDIGRTGHSVWVVNSNATRPEIVQPFCHDHDARYVIFVSRLPRNAKSDDGPPSSERAQEYSIDGRKWLALPFWPKDPKGLSEVTGKINRATAGYWFDALEEVSSGELDVRSYSKLTGEILEGFQKHESAYPVRRPGPVGRTGYQVLGVDRLASPFAAWLKK